MNGGEKFLILSYLAIECTATALTDFLVSRLLTQTMPPQAMKRRQLVFQHNKCGLLVVGEIGQVSSA